MALILFASSVAMSALAGALAVLPGSELIPLRPSVGEVLIFVLTFIAFPSVGLVVAWKRPRNPIGWMFIVIGLGVTASIFASEYTDRALYAGADLPGVALVAWIGSGIWLLAPSLALTFAVLLFPSGRLPSPRWRPFAWVTAATIAVVSLAEMLRPGGIDGYEETSLERPVSIGGPAGDLLSGIAAIGLLPVLALGLASVASLLVRFRRSTGTERQQLKWFLYPTALLLLGLVAVAVLRTDAGWIVAILGLGLVPVGAGIAILRHRLFDIDLVINRTLVYVTLTVLLGAVYIGLVLGLQALISPLVGTDTVAVALSTLAVAALFGPARRWVQQAVDRRFYRSRYDAQRALGRFAAGLRSEVDPRALAGALQGTAQEALQPLASSVWLRERGR